MRISQVIGTVTLSQSLPSFKGCRLRFVRPLSLDELTGKAEPAADPIVAWDELGANIGDQIALAEGPEASQPFRPEIKPVDAYNAGILDRVDIREEL